VLPLLVLISVSLSGCLLAAAAGGAAVGGYAVEHYDIVKKK
tara:strand:+ start:133 stop:255 length:123 start_codon:yes stop_codon:yes gene_type:complete